MPGNATRFPACFSPDSDNPPNHRIRRVVILGGGSAGFLVALGLRKYIPEIELVIIRSREIGVIGVGEGTIWSVKNFLHRFLEIDTREFYCRARPTIKLGIRYLWGKRPFFNYTFSPQLSQPLERTRRSRGYFCDREWDFADEASALMNYGQVCIRNACGIPRLIDGHAYHLENRQFVSLLESLAEEAGIPAINDVVCGVAQDASGIKALYLESGGSVAADLFVDCSGFRSMLAGEALGSEFVDFGQSLFCDSAVLGKRDRGPQESILPYTTAETMNAGWSWQIEHLDHVHRGYVYSSSFTSPDNAAREFRNRNPQLDITGTVRFRSGARRQTWLKNVIAVGNAAGFVEPLEATAIGVICDSTVRIVKALKSTGLRHSRTVAEAYSRIQFENWEIIRDFLAIHYRYNQRLKTPFWQACNHDIPLGKATPIVELYQEVGPDLSFISTEMRRDFFDVEGYLAMLVGQQVPYRLKKSLTAGEKHQWQLYKNRLRESMLNTMNMHEYFEYVIERESD